MQKMKMVKESHNLDKRKFSGAMLAALVTINMDEGLLRSVETKQLT